MGLVHRVACAVVVDEAAPHREITAATEAGLAAARAALPDATVRAEGALEKLPDGRRKARVTLVVSAARDDPAVAEGAREAFADAFVARLAARGFDATRVG